MRLGAIFVVVCMVVIAASAGATVYLGFGFTGTEAIIVALSVATALGLYNTFSTRMGVRSMVGSQLSELSRSNFELARQMNDLGKRLSAVEGRVEGVQHRARAAIDPLAVEISELGTLVRQLAETVATYETRFGEAANVQAAPAPTVAEAVRPAFAPLPPAQPVAAPPAPAAEPLPTLVEDIVQAVSPTPIAVPAPPPPAPEPAPQPEPVVSAAVAASNAEDEARLAAIRSAIDANRIDLYLQPIVTLPQRKVRYYEAMSRLRTETGDVLLAADFIPQAERAGLMPRIDNLVVFRCVQVVRRLLLKNRDIGLFCNLSESTLTDGMVFPQLLDFLDANRAIAPSVVLEFTQSALRAAGPIENEIALGARRPRLPLLARQSAATCGSSRATSRRAASAIVKIPANLLLNPKDGRVRHPSCRPVRPARPFRHRPDRREDRERGDGGRPARLRRPLRPGLPVLAAAAGARRSAAGRRRPRRRRRARWRHADEHAGTVGRRRQAPAANGAGNGPRTTGLAQLARGVPAAFDAGFDAAVGSSKSRLRSDPDPCLPRSMSPNASTFSSHSRRLRRITTCCCRTSGASCTTASRPRRTPARRCAGSANGGGTVVLITNAPRPGDFVQQVHRPAQGAARQLRRDRQLRRRDARADRANAPANASLISARSATCRSSTVSARRWCRSRARTTSSAPACIDDTKETPDDYDDVIAAMLRAQAADDLRQSRHRGRARRASGLLRRRDRRSLCRQRAAT